MKRHRIFRSQTGDTLVEVILALAILGLVLGGSSVLASKSYKNLQGTQERSAGQRLAQSQLEFIKTFAVTNPDALATVPSQFCMATVGTAKVPVAATDPKCARINTGGAPVTEAVPGYKLVTTVQEDAGGYNIKAQVQWDDLGGKTDSNELTYRIYKKVGASSEAGTGGCTTPGFMPNPVAGATPPCVPIPPQIQLIAKKIPYTAAQATSTGVDRPNCSLAATTNRGGTSVRLRKIGSNPEADRNQSTASSSSATLFDNLTANGTYETSITGVPAGHELCPGSALPSTVDTTTLTAGTVYPKNINVKIRPVCTFVWKQDNLGYYSDNLGYYSDNLGYYSDYLGTYPDLPFYPGHPQWTHPGWDGRRNWSAGDKEYWEGSQYVHYRWRGDLGSNSSGWFFERWVANVYAHYSAPYTHWSAPYTHWSAPYTHYGPWYKYWTCP